MKMARAEIRKVKTDKLDESMLPKVHVDVTGQQDDHFDYSKVVVKKPWGYEYLLFENQVVAVWILYIKHGFQTSLHCHPNKKTALIVLSGEARCTTLHEKLERKHGQGLLIDKGCFHSTEALSPEGIFVMEAETPTNKRDLVRLSDAYGREGKGYETAKDMQSREEFAVGSNISFDNQNYNYISKIEPTVYYNTRKRFGKSSVTLVRFKDNSEFVENFCRKEWDLLCVLSGQLMDEKNEVILAPGDCVSRLDLEKYKSFKITTELELILVKQSDTMTRLSDFVISFVKNKKMFIVPENANLHLTDSVMREPNLNYVFTQTEQSAVIAAEACSKLTNEASLVIISSGASATNVIRGVADAWVDSAPVIVISGQTVVSQTKDNLLIRQLGNKEIRITDVVSPITKYAVMIKEPAEIRYELEKASHLAKHSRFGPVWIDIPVDIQGMNIDEEKLRSFDTYELSQDSEIRADELSTTVKKILALLKQAKRPALLAGGGIRLSAGEKEFLMLVEMIGIPILTTRRGADLIEENHPMFFGRPGAYGQRSANFIIQNCDLLVSIGARLSVPQIGRNYDAFARAAKKVVVDVDPAELKKKTVHPDLEVQCDAKRFMIELMKQLGGFQKNDISGWIERCGGWRKKFPNCPDEFKDQKEFVNPYFFMDLLSNELSENEVIVVDGGACLNYFLQGFRFKKGQRLIASTGLEASGFALAGSIGACIGNEKKRIVCICEDKGFQNNVQELLTIVANSLPIHIFVLNSSGYSATQKDQKQYFGGRYTTTVPGAFFDIIKIGEAYGLSVESLSSHFGMREKLGAFLRNKKHAICQINLDKNQQIIPRLVLTVKPDGEWVSRPLEDMYPYLDDEEFRQNMIIKPLR